jgi:hypothetical protein
MEVVLPRLELPQENKMSSAIRIVADAAMIRVAVTRRVTDLAKDLTMIQNGSEFRPRLGRVANVSAKKRSS